MTTLDWSIVASYFCLLIGIVFWSSRKQATSTDYFLAGREIGWFVVGCSLLASNIGSEHIVGLAGNGATSGMAMAHWELHAWIILLLGWIFVPFYYRSGVFTMPEFLERRFNSRTRWALSIVSLVAYVFTKVSVTVYAGAIVFQALLPDTFGSPENAFWIGAITTVVLTGIYTIFGGLRAVVYTEVAQTVLLLAGSAFITIFALGKLGGWDELKAVLGANPGKFALWRPLSDPNFPWLGVMIASPIIGIWYWCTDQYIVQRTLAARDLTQARRGAIFGGFLKVLPVFLFLIPGMIGYALYEKGMLPLATNADGSVRGDAVFPTMVSTLLPAGLRGIVVAGLLSSHPAGRQPARRGGDRGGRRARHRDAVHRRAPLPALSRAGRARSEAHCAVRGRPPGDRGGGPPGGLPISIGPCSGSPASSASSSRDWPASSPAPRATGTAARPRPSSASTSPTTRATSTGC
jgi:SSS family solute:Na+ symporter